MNWPRINFSGKKSFRKMVSNQLFECLESSMDNAKVFLRFSQNIHRST